MENSNTLWTPGPWSVEWYSESNAEILAGRNIVLAELDWYGADEGELRELVANARLIAAAPEMAGVLHYARKLIGPDVIIDAIIARIEGADHGE